MRRLYCGALLFTTIAGQALAEPRSFAASDPSGQYLIEALFPEPPPQAQQLGRALISIRDNQTLAPLQQLQTDAGNLPRVYSDGTLGWLMGENSLVFFKDFNFDGRLDLAIRNGTGHEDSWAFDVYLQDPDKVHWTLHPELSALARSGHMFSAYAEKRVIYSQTDRGCCWTRLTTYQWQGNALERLSTYTQEEIPASDDDSTSMPSGYMLRTSGDWKDGQWVEVPRVEGPVIEPPLALSGTLGDKIPVELWYQEQGAVIIGELRYPRSGSGQPITLVGERGEYDGKPYIYLFEFTDDGRRTGIWEISPTLSQTRRYTGKWVKPDLTDKRELAVDLASSKTEPPLDKLNELPAEQRSGRYQMLDDFLGRDGVLDLTILPERDAQGREVAEFTITLTKSNGGEAIITEHHRVPMETGNLIIVRDPLYPKATGPYHIQLVKGFAVLAYNAEADTPLMMSGMYRKQP